MTCTFPPKRRRCATRSSATAVAAAAAAADADAFLPSSYHLSFAISGPIDPTPEKAPKLALEGEAEEEEEDARAGREKEGAAMIFFYHFLWIAYRYGCLLSPTYLSFSLFPSLISRLPFLFFFCCCLCSLSVSFSPSARCWICFFCPLGWILVSRCLGPHPFGKGPPPHLSSASSSFPRLIWGPSSFVLLRSLRFVSLRGLPFDGSNLFHVRGLGLSLS